METVEIKIVSYMEILYVIGLNSGIKVRLEVTECGIITNTVKFETYSMN